MATEQEIDNASQQVLHEMREGDVIDNNVAAPIHNVGLDIGTMNIVSAKRANDDSISLNTLRNMFLSLDSNTVGNTFDLDLLSHVIIDDVIYLLSDTAYDMANAFGKQVSRPMSKGLINPDEIDSVEILGLMIKKLIGTAITPNDICCYSIPAESIDSDNDIIYHESVFSRIIQQLGYKPISMNEALAVIYVECAQTNFTGIGISFGAGMTNIAVAFKSMPILTFSLARGGDWIDINAAKFTAMPSNRITAVKEKSTFSLTSFTGTTKKERRANEALIHYYLNLINYTLDSISSKLLTLDIEFPTEIPIVISGGTSKPNGFIDLVNQSLVNVEFPFSISEVRHAKNPLTAVAEGCLIRSYQL